MISHWYKYHEHLILKEDTISVQPHGSYMWRAIHNNNTVDFLVQFELP